MSKPDSKKHILFDKVSRSFDGVRALNKLSFSVDENEFVALVGNNGCGKSTTINIICNFIPHDEGSAYVLDTKIVPGNSSYKSQLGIVLSSHYSIAEFSATEYLSFVAEFQKVDKKEAKTRINDLFGVLAFDEHKSKKIKDLSSGSRMKVSVAAALIHNPKLLILDEPFVNLDVQTVDALKHLLLEFKEKKTLFITSHNIDLVSELCSRFIVMEEGSVKAEIVNDRNLPSHEVKELIRSHLVKENNPVKKLDWLN